ncbi:nucleotidyltransferase family protein [Achromobacter sp. GG226]|uniref:nucleotidyltransferase family protein n=1 Tax=Verticiella alkaliphila TaxID=2779529 RepID=UPI001C0C1266|nr:nucleotidyltransferase family protein [Verticiella sp. GG226]MBU4610295.1 nucleotidyltransferase family protein [Verticiella sp. GG226]
MKPSVAMEAHRDAIRRIVASHRALNPRVFGSVLYGKDRDGSDLDILVDPLSNTTLFDIGAIQRELRELLGVEVDVLTPDDLPDRWRGRVLREAQPV